MPLDHLVAVYSYEPTYEALANPKKVAGGLFYVAVPGRVVAQSTADDLEPLEYVVTMDLDVVDERLVCVRCEIAAKEGGPSVTAEAIRRVPIASVLRQAANSGLAVWEVDPDNPDNLRGFVGPPRDFAEAGMTDQVLRDVARLYHWYLAIGEPPLGMLERYYGIPRGKASRWIATGRRRGYVKDKGE